MQAAGEDGYVQRSDAREMRRKVAGMAGMAGVRGLTLGSYSAVLCSILQRALCGASTCNACL